MKGMTLGEIFSAKYWFVPYIPLLITPMEETMKCVDCNLPMIYTPLGRIELQNIFGVKYWNEFQYICHKCGKKSEVFKNNIAG